MIVLLAHFRQRHGAHGHGRGHGVAAHGGKAGAACNAGHGKTAGQTAEPHVGGIEKLARYAGIIGELAHENEQGNNGVGIFRTLGIGGLSYHGKRGLGIGLQKQKTETAHQRHGKTYGHADEKQYHHDYHGQTAERTGGNGNVQSTEPYGHGEHDRRRHQRHDAAGNMTFAEAAAEAFKRMGKGEESEQKHACRTHDHDGPDGQLQIEAHFPHRIFGHGGNGHAPRKGQQQRSAGTPDECLQQKADAFGTVIGHKRDVDMPLCFLNAGQGKEGNKSKGKFFQFIRAFQRTVGHITKNDVHEDGNHHQRHDQHGNTKSPAGGRGQHPLQAVSRRFQHMLGHSDTSI